jgi:hypothetical protein
MADHLLTYHLSFWHAHRHVMCVNTRLVHALAVPLLVAASLSMVQLIRSYRLFVFLYPRHLLFRFFSFFSFFVRLATCGLQASDEGYDLRLTDTHDGEVEKVIRCPSHPSEPSS